MGIAIISPGRNPSAWIKNIKEIMPVLLLKKTQKSLNCMVKRSQLNLIKLMGL